MPSNGERSQSDNWESRSPHRNRHGPIWQVIPTNSSFASTENSHHPGWHPRRRSKILAVCRCRRCKSRPTSSELPVSTDSRCVSSCGSPTPSRRSDSQPRRSWWQREKKIHRFSCWSQVRSRCRTAGLKSGAVGPGELVGELSSIDGGPSAERACAATPVVALRLRREPLMALMAEVPAFTIALSQLLAVRVRSLQSELTERSDAQTDETGPTTNRRNGLS